MTSDSGEILDPQSTSRIDEFTAFGALRCATFSGPVQCGRPAARRLLFDTGIPSFLECEMLDPFLKTLALSPSPTFTEGHLFLGSEAQNWSSQKTMVHHSLVRLLDSATETSPTSASRPSTSRGSSYRYRRLSPDVDALGPTRVLRRSSAPSMQQAMVRDVGAGTDCWS